VSEGDIRAALHRIGGQVQLEELLLKVNREYDVPSLRDRLGQMRKAGDVELHQVTITRVSLTSQGKEKL
jgi:hypothetical protein